MPWVRIYWRNNKILNWPRDRGFRFFRILLYIGRLLNLRRAPTNIYVCSFVLRQINEKSTKMRQRDRCKCWTKKVGKLVAPSSSSSTSEAATATAAADKRCVYQPYANSIITGYHSVTQRHEQRVVHMLYWTGIELPLSFCSNGLNRLFASHDHHKYTHTHTLETMLFLCPLGLWIPNSIDHICERKSCAQLCHV